MPTFLRTHNKKLDEWYDMEWMDTFFLLHTFRLWLQFNELQDDDHLIDLAEQNHTSSNTKPTIVFWGFW